MTSHLKIQDVIIINDCVQVIIISWAISLKKQFKDLDFKKTSALSLFVWFTAQRFCGSSMFVSSLIYAYAG